MEYPFKDLLPLDEVLEREGYYKDWTHLDPEVFYSLTQISEYIKIKGFGVDVRLLIAQLAEHFGLKSTQIIDLANLLQQQFTNLEGATQSFTDNINSLVAQMEADKNAVIANATVDSEVILARGGNPTLQARLDRDKAVVDVLKKDIGVSLSDYPRVHPETTDDGRFNRAIAALESVNHPTVGWGSGTTNFLVVPRGDYVITTTILIPAHFVMIGVGMPTIEQLTSGISSFSTDISKSFALNNIYINGISFFRGKHALAFVGHNEDNSQIVISRCQFHKTTDYAIYTWADTGDNHQSTQILIEQSKFMNCNGSFYNVCDVAVVDFCWIYIDKETLMPDRAVFVNQNEQRRLTIKNSVGVPTMGEGAERVPKVRWVDNWGHFRAYDTRFGGEENGIPILYQYAGNDPMANTPNFNTSVIIRDSHISSGEPFYDGQINVSDSGVVRLMGNKIPPIIKIEGNSYIVGVPYISAPVEFNLSTYMASFVDRYNYFDIDIKSNATINTQVASLGMYRWPQAMDKIVNKGVSRAGIIKKSFIAQGTGAGTAIMYLDFDFKVIEKLVVSGISFYGDPAKPTNVLATKINDQLFSVTFNLPSFTASTVRIGTIEIMLT